MQSPNTIRPVNKPLGIYAIFFINYERAVQCLLLRAVIFCSQRVTGVSPVDSARHRCAWYRPVKCSSPESCARLRRRHRVPRGPNDGSTVKNEQSQIADDLSPTPAVKHEPLLRHGNLTVPAPHWRRHYTRTPRPIMCDACQLDSGPRVVRKQAGRLLTRGPRFHQPVAVGKGVAQVETAYPFQHPRRLSQVLKNIGADDHIERSGRDLELQAFDFPGPNMVKPPCAAAAASGSSSIPETLAPCRCVIASPSCPRRPQPISSTRRAASGTSATTSGRGYPK